MNSPRLRYLPLGGLGEVGINMWALEWENKVLVVDAGLMFPQEDMLGIDLVLPDISYLLQGDREVLGIFLTHGHEDHIGGLPFALKKLNVPVYGTRLTLGLVKPKLREHRILRESDLRVAIVGRSLQQNFKTAQELGFLSVPDGVVVPLADVDHIAPAKLLLLTAGSQGEPMSALTRFAAQKHPFLNVLKDDWVVISARPIPGNERMVHQTVNNLYRHGARVFYSEVGNVHVTGHAQRDELREMLDAVRPRFFIPVHGEYRQLLLHSELAKEAGLGADQIAVVEDGETVELDADSMIRGEKVGTGLVYVDGLGVGDVEQVVLRDRRHLAEDGILVVTLTLDRDTGTVRAGPELISRGVIEPELSVRLMADARKEVLESIRRFANSRSDLSLLQEAIHDAVSKTVYRQTRRRPMVIPVITEI